MKINIPYKAPSGEIASHEYDAAYLLQHFRVLSHAAREIVIQVIRLRTVR